MFCDTILVLNVNFPRNITSVRFTVTRFTYHLSLFTRNSEKKRIDWDITYGKFCHNDKIFIEFPRFICHFN